MKAVLRPILAALVCGALAPAATAGERIHVRDAWMPVYTDRAHSAPVFLTLVNLAGEPDRLLAARAEGAAAVTIRAMNIEGGEARQREIAAVELPPGIPVPLHAGGAYLVLEGLKPSARPRGTQTIRLVFEHAGEREYRVKLRPLALGNDTLEHLRTDPLQQPGKPVRTEGLDDALRTDPLLH